MNYHSLTKSPVRFSEADHRYTTTEGRQLSGVTSILGAVIFHDKYEGIPQHVLDAAAQRGTEIHARCAEIDLFDSTEASAYDRPEVKNYIKLKTQHGITIIANEYLVSDERRVATMIDALDSEGNLYDIKTTAQLDTDYLSWQLSIGAYLFELQNPELRAGRLFGIWLRGDRAERVEVERRSSEEIEELLSDYEHGIVRAEAIPEELTETNNVALRMVQGYERELAYFKAMMDRIEEEKARALDTLRQTMEEAGVKQIETERIKVTLVAESRSKTFDSTRFKKEHPDLAEQFQKETTRKAHVKITLRG